MKESYSETEKKIIEYIIQKYRNNEIISTSKILYENWSVIAVERVAGDKIAIISEDKDISEQKFTESQKSVFEILNILKYLEDHYLLTVYPNDNPSERLFNEAMYSYFPPPKSKVLETPGDWAGAFASYYKKNGNEFLAKNFSKIETNVNVYNSLSRYIGGLCYPSTELKIFYDNKYKTPEQVRFDKNYCITKVALILSIILGLLGIFVPCCPRISSEKRLIEKTHIIHNLENDTVFISTKDILEYPR